MENKRELDVLLKEGSSKSPDRCAVCTLMGQGICRILTVHSNFSDPVSRSGVCWSHFSLSPLLREDPDEASMQCPMDGGFPGFMHKLEQVPSPASYELGLSPLLCVDVTSSASGSFLTRVASGSIMNILKDPLKIVLVTGLLLGR